MNIQEKSRAEYLSRINLVMDYIDRNLEHPLDLNVIASIASFSPFHFHRIFTFLIGETPIDYIQRLRIEKAAWRLREKEPMSVTEIAYTCGFGSVSLFSRTFKKYYGLTPSQFSKEEKPAYSQGSKLFSKNGQMLRKNLKNDAEDDYDLCIVESNKIFFMETKVEVKEMPEFHVIYCRHTGAFDKIYEAYHKVAQWATPRGLYFEGKTKSMTVTHDDPSVTEIDKVRESACIILDGTIDDVKVEGEIGKMTVPGGKYAVGRFELSGPDFEKAWNTMCKWFTESGYQQGDGWTYELYANDEVPKIPGKMVVDICIPVKPL